MSETCGCGARIEGVKKLKHLREWRATHQHHAPRPPQGPGGATSWIGSDYQPDYVPSGVRA